MNLLKESVDQKKFDTRVMEKNIQRGVITHDEAPKLPDDSDNATWVSLESLIESKDLND